LTHFDVKFMTPLHLNKLTKRGTVFERSLPLNRLSVAGRKLFAKSVITARSWCHPRSA
jgi:hypothetical protein